jgi:NAD+ diphosphatase
MGGMTDKLIAVRDGSLLVREEGGGVAFPTREELEAAGVDVSTAHALRGLTAIGVDRDVPGYEARGVRSLFAVLPPEDLAAAGSALHAVRWAETSRFCGRCGTPTERVAEERAMKCPKCGLVFYPRISPAIIVLVRRGDEALLARNARFPGAFYSTLAGFSEIGESLEETLVREVKEEVGVDVGNVRYFGSQPWPFPDSLMIGYNADWLSGDIRVDETEIVDARFFRRDEKLPTQMLPPKISIARRLIDAWLAGN